MKGFAVSIITALVAFSSPGMAMAVAGSTVRYAPYSYAFGLTSCLLWIDFGQHDHLQTLWRLSSVGALAYAAYLALFLWNSEAGDARRTWLLRYVSGSCVAVLLAGFVLRILGLHAAYNYVCAAVACCASVAPLWNLPAVYRTKTMDAMPSLIVAGPLLANAIIWTWRNTVGAETVNLNLAIPSGVAMLSSLVQVVLHLLCWCLPRPVVAAPDTGIDPRPLLGNQGQTEAAGGGNGGNSGNANGSETKVDIKSLEELADVKNDGALNLLLRNGPEDVHDVKNDHTLNLRLSRDIEDVVDVKNETIGALNVPLRNGLEDVPNVKNDNTLNLRLSRDLEDVVDVKNETIGALNVLLRNGPEDAPDVKNDDTLNLRLSLDLEDVVDVKNESSGSLNLQLTQDRQDKICHTKNGTVDLKNGLPQDAEEKPAEVVVSKDSSARKVDQVDTSLPEA